MRKREMALERSESSRLRGNCMSVTWRAVDMVSPWSQSRRPEFQTNNYL